MWQLPSHHLLSRHLSHHLLSRHLFHHLLSRHLFITLCCHLSHHIITSIHLSPHLTTSFIASLHLFITSFLHLFISSLHLSHHLILSFILIDSVRFLTSAGANINAVDKLGIDWCSPHCSVACSDCMHPTGEEKCECSDQQRGT